MGLYLKDKSNRLILPYNDGASSYSDFIYWKDYEDVIVDNNIDSVSNPTHYTIIDDGTLDSQATGTCTSAGALLGGQATLTDSSGDFSDVSAGDTVHNTTDGSMGIVLSKTSSTSLVTALFGGTDNDWDSSDAYVIQPQGRLQIKLDPPPSTAGHTLTAHYVQRPAPVYSDYGIFRFQSQNMDAIIKYAAFNYKYRDQEPQFGDALYVHWDRQVRLSNNVLGKSIGRGKIGINFKKRR
jgi:hypothetical protein